MKKKDHKKYPYIIFLLILYGLISIFSFSGKSFAEDFILMATCESPKGPRIDYGDIFDLQGQKIQSTDQGFIIGEDGYSNMKPSFFINSEEPNILYSIWGNAVPDDLKNILTAKDKNNKTEKNTIINKNDFVITATRHIQGTRGGTTWMVTLYPKMGIGYFTSHSHVINSLGINNNTNTDTTSLAAKCNFSVP
mgnify:CR=1 FL=1